MYETFFNLVFSLLTNTAVTLFETLLNFLLNLFKEFLKKIIYLLTNPYKCNIFFSI